MKLGKPFILSLSNLIYKEKLVEIVETKYGTHDVLLSPARA
jgi:hypothetical protein